uniref:Akh2 n=1 Tax=Arundo donax TaxID=35708 RepID=A0A0A9G2F6_ARUDO
MEVISQQPQLVLLSGHARSLSGLMLMGYLVQILEKLVRL